MAQERVNAAPVISVNNPNPDEVGRLFTEAAAYAKAGQTEKAIGVWKKIMDMTPISGRGWGNSPPYGNACWSIAETHRAQGQWREALDFYRLHHATSPYSDGCIASGAAEQYMALREGVCLEELRRTDEAVGVYWAAALQLKGEIPAYAMRRLVDLYMAQECLPVLEAVVKREHKAYKLSVLADADENVASIMETLSAFPAFERVVRARLAAAQRDWPALLLLVQAPQKPDEHVPEFDSASVQRGEAYAALATIATESIPLLESALKKEPTDKHLITALLRCYNHKQRQQWWNKHPAQRHPELEWLLRESSEILSPYNWEPPAKFPALSKKVALPVELPSIYKVRQKR